MRIPVVLLALALCALPLLGQKAERRIVAPCELTSATMTLSGEESKTDGRGYAIRVINNSASTIALPRAPVFGWRVEILEHRVWHLKAEGGPVRRVNAKDGHIMVLGNPSPTPLVEIPPAHSQDFEIFLPEAEKALQPTAQFSTLKLTLYWAASTEWAQMNRKFPPCAVTSEWVVSMQKLVPLK